METILITGGAGFLGSHVARQLVGMGYRVVIYDSFVQYVSPLESAYQAAMDDRFKDLLDQVTVIRGDTANKADLRRCVVAYRPNRIIHLAALPIADLSNVHSEEARNTIVYGTVNVLETIRDVEFVERFVYASSSMVYGDFQYAPADEEHPKSPKDIYGGSKLAGEIMTQSFARRFDIPYTIVRPSALYGPTDVNLRVSQIFLENALAGRELILHNGGTSRLDFTYVTDAAEGVVLATFASAAENEVFNITRGEGRSLIEYVEILKDHFPDLQTIEQPADVVRPERGALDISKARKLLGYEPKVALEEGLQLYVDYVRGGMIGQPQMDWGYDSIIASLPR